MNRDIRNIYKDILIKSRKIVIIQPYHILTFASHEYIDFWARQRQAHIIRDGLIRETISAYSLQPRGAK